MSQGYAFGKRYAESKHAVQRARERYGIALSPGMVSRVSMLVASGSLTPQFYEFSKHVIYEFDWAIIDPDGGSKNVKIAFNPDTGNIVTFLPRDWTPEAGLQHKTRRHEELVQQNREAMSFHTQRLFAEFDELHPLPVLTDNVEINDKLVRAAMDRLQEDRHIEPQFRTLRRDRLETLTRFIVSIKAELKEMRRIRHEQSLEDARKRKEAKRTPIKRELVVAGDMPPPNEIPQDAAHSFAIAVSELVDDQSLRVAIFLRARQLNKLIATQVEEQSA